MVLKKHSDADNAL